MYQNQFLALLQQNKTFGAYMFYGQSPYLIEHYASLVISQDIAKGSEIQKIYFNDFDAKEVASGLSQASLFSPSTTIVARLHNPLRKKEATIIFEALKRNKDNNIIFICLQDSEFKTMAGYFTPAFDAVSVRFFTPDLQEALTALQIKSQKIDLDIDRTTLTHLYNMHNHKLSDCINDLDKLVILKTKITTKLVDLYCFNISNINFEEFCHNLIMGQNVSNDILMLIESGLKEAQLMRRINDYIVGLIGIRSYIKLHGTFDSRAVFGYALPRDIIDQRVRLSNKYKLEKLTDALLYAQDLELVLKTDKFIDKISYTQAHLNRISNILKD